MRTYIFIITLGALMLSACRTQSPNAEEKPVMVRDFVKILAGMMEGDYDNVAQANADSNFLKISLRMKRIWKENKEGIWLYVEQAMFDKQEKPYRQRIYQLSMVEGMTVKSEIYTLPNPEQYVGGWKNEKTFDVLSPSQISLKSGCGVNLTYNAKGFFSGATDAQSCPSEIRGASYATSDVWVDNTMLKALDMGFDKEGKQVWGSKFGHYIFVKKTE